MIGDAALIIAAGGSGTRYGSGNKLFTELNGIPLVIHSVRNLGKLFPPECRIMAVPPGAEQEFAEVLQKYAPDTPFRLIPGGTDRTKSVQNALAAVPEGIRYVAIHDGARPLATARLLESVLEAARQTGGAVPGHPVMDTLKRVDENGMTVETVSRERVYAVETPQCFDAAKLRNAFRRCPDSLTDDAGTMEMAGYPVTVVPNPECNLKLTRPEDLLQLQKALP
ncbi:MAG: 2-C-methyl-D-erythritol 4-phosphate cytidylyltransferase [Lentisphaeria bacterium]|nr:2-C-methyl-D-erythritol 4-phosphate cytidylyltransferase [Lentisphaeria bacterium]